MRRVFIFGERYYLKKLTVNYVKGFLRTLVAFCIRYYPCEQVTAVTQQSRDDLHELCVRGFQITLSPILFYS